MILTDPAFFGMRFLLFWKNLYKICVDPVSRAFVHKSKNATEKDPGEVPEL